MKFIAACCDWTDVAVVECQIAALRYALPNTHFVSVAVRKFSIINCAFLVRLMAESLPRGSVIVGCVDPRIPGINRIPIAVYFSSIDLYFVGPNTGTISMLLDSFRSDTIIHLSYNDWNKNQFLGRNLFSPVAGKLIAGAPIESFGEIISIEDIYHLNFPKYTILHIDNFGNLKINCRISQLPVNKFSSINVNGIPAIFAQDFKDITNTQTIEPDQLIVTVGSSLDFLEIQRKAQNTAAIGAAELLKVEVGDEISINFN